MAYRVSKTAGVHYRMSWRIRRRRHVVITITYCHGIIVTCYVMSIDGDADMAYGDD